MRNKIVFKGSEELHYEIREIVKIGNTLEDFGIKIIWENIGDPIAKGEQVPKWIQDIIAKGARENRTYAYCPTAGLPETRNYISDIRKKEGADLSPENILFFNGLGDAISKIYTNLAKEARVIGPEPAYPTHSSAEAAHAKSPHITYKLRPEKNWLPDLEDLENKIKYNQNISGILVINPDNPTGIVYPRKVLDGFVKLALKYKLFIISDEIYRNLIYGDIPFTNLAKIAKNRIPIILMRGLSKEVPWPGSRCGWCEFYNPKNDKEFSKYIKSIQDSKMLEVCSTTLPQKVLPDILGNKKYWPYLKKRNKIYGQKAKIAFDIFSNTANITCPKTQGAYYMSVVFNRNKISNKSNLKISNKKAKIYVDKIIKGKSLDKKFAYQLMASTGICIVPLSGFNTNIAGFRITLLEPDVEKFTKIVETISDKIKEFTKEK